MSGTANFGCHGNLDAAAFHVKSPNGALVSGGSRTIATPIDNDDTVTVSAGMLTMAERQRRTDHTGVWQIADGATLYFNGSDLPPDRRLGDRHRRHPHRHPHDRRRPDARRRASASTSRTCASRAAR